MDKYDKGKLKVLIKMILIQRSPNRLTANQLKNIINQYDWGFRTSITSAKIGKILSDELRNNNKHFLDCVSMSKRNGGNVYYISSCENI